MSKYLNPNINLDEMFMQLVKKIEINFMFVLDVSIHLI